MAKIIAGCAILTAMARALRDAMGYDWRRSMATDRDPSVGYLGVIAPDLTRMDEGEVARAIAFIRRGSGQVAEGMERSV